MSGHVIVYNRVVTIEGEMKYLQTIDLIGGGVENNIDTTLPDIVEPYNIELITSDGRVITGNLGDPEYTSANGSLRITIYNGGSTLYNVKLKLLY